MKFYKWRIILMVALTMYRAVGSWYWGIWILLMVTLTMYWAMGSWYWGIWKNEYSLSSHHECYAYNSTYLLILQLNVIKFDVFCVCAMLASKHF